MDIFSRIFAIPSDVSSTEEDAQHGAGAGNAAGTTGRKKKGHSRTLTPLSFTDGNGTLTSQSYGEGTLSYGSASRSLEDGHDEPLSPTSTSSDIEDHSYDVMEDNTKPRGRQRSSSEQPTSRFHDISKKKQQYPHHQKHRSSSMASSSRRSSSGTGAATGMQLQLNSPSKKHHSRSRTTSGGKSKDPTLTRVHSWSSGEEDTNERRRRRRSRSTSQQHKQKDDRRRRSSSNSNPQRNDKHSNAAAAASSKKKATISTTTAVKKEKNYWRGFMKKHLSPGMSSASGTPPQHKTKRPSKKGSGSSAVYTSRSSKKKSSAHGQSSPSERQKDNTKPRLNLPPSAVTRKQPINVGDNIIISQQFLEESAEMSVLTLPRELAAEEAKARALGMMDEDIAQADDDEEDEFYDREIQQVGQRTVLENDRVHAYYNRQYNNNNSSRGDNHHPQQQEEGIPSSSTGVSSTHQRGPIYEQIGAYASRVIQQEGMGNNIYATTYGSSQDSIVHDNGDGGIEVRPVHQQRLGLGMPPPPPPPPPSHPLPPRSGGPSSRSPRNSNIPHWNTPASSNSESIATSYDDPPGMLVTSPTLQLQPSSSFGNNNNLENKNDDRKPTSPSAADPPGDPYIPFDEQSGFHQIPPQGGNNNSDKLRSNKAVTFSLPPPTTSSNNSPPAPPFMGPTYDYYYSMERSNDHSNSTFNFSLSTGILPPIIELYSVVESSDTMPGGDIGGGNAIPVSAWDATREDALIGGEGEEGHSLPLIVAGEWIYACDVKKQTVDVTSSYHLNTSAANSVAEVSETINGAAAVDVAFAFSVDKRSRAACTWNEEDTPHDEYFNDILDCGEAGQEDHPAEERIAAVECTESQQVAQRQTSSSSDLSSKYRRQAYSVIPRVNDQSPSDTLDHDDEDANVRHRSSWNAAYKPPKLSSLEYDPSIHEQQHNNDQWQKTLRIRNQAAIILQKSIRGLLERSKLDRLIDATLVIQQVIRRYLSRKRYVEYIKLKRSYYPSRWRRNNVAVAV